MRFVAAFVVVLAAACGSSTSSLPTHALGPTDSAPAGVITGTLTERAGCVFVTGEESPLLVVWPRSYVRLGQQIMDDGKPVAQIGELVRLGGGSISYELLQRPPLSADIPASCRTGIYWMTTGILPSLPSPTGSTGSGR